MQQITINFDAGLTESYSSCREFVGARIHQLGVEQKKPHKTIAADMDLSPSKLTRKIAQADTSRFTLDDFEKYIEVTGDKKPVLYLVEKYLTSPDEEALIKQIEMLQSQLKGKRK
jgi:hypothetical protein